MRTSAILPSQNRTRRGRREAAHSCPLVEIVCFGLPPERKGSENAAPSRPCMWEGETSSHVCLAGTRRSCVSGHDTRRMPFFTNDKKQLEISAGIGVSLFPDYAESARDLLQASDEAMYLAKKSGRNQVVHSHRLATPPPTPVAAADRLQPTPRSDHAARHEDARRASEPVAAHTIRRRPLPGNCVNARTTVPSWSPMS